MQRPCVSVVMTTYNRAAMVTTAMASVIAQRYRPLELLVVDDGSNDDTGETVQRFIARQRRDSQLQLRYLRQDNAGPAGARNRGLHASRGDYVLFMDDDDLMDSAAVTELVRVLAEVDEPAVAYGSYASVDASGTPNSARTPAPPRKSSHALVSALIRGTWFVPTHGYLFNRRALEQAGLWDGELPSQEDDEFTLRASLCGVSFLPAERAMVFYRQHGGLRRSRPGRPGQPDERGRLRRLEADLRIREQAYRVLHDEGRLNAYATAFAAWYRRLVSRYGAWLRRPEYAVHPVILWAQTQALRTAQPMFAMSGRERLSTVSDRLKSRGPRGRAIHGGIKRVTVEN